MQCERDLNDGDVQGQKSSVYFVHNLNKLQQVKLSALWILAILSIILIIITNMASSFRDLSLYVVFC